MSELLAFQGDLNDRVVVEVAEEDPGFQLIAAPGGKVAVAARGLGEMLGAVRSTIAAVVTGIADLEVPDTHRGEITVEFGVKCSAEAGAYIAKATGEGHLTVTVRWPPPPRP
jgi:NTP-dependent ternary system trypsin peptidase co-occuring protein